MEINKKIIDTIDNFVDKCDYFDSVYKNIIKIIGNNINDNINELYDLVDCYIDIRKDHGIILKLYENFKNNCDENNEKDMYDLSSLNSMLDNIKNLIKNIDFQYKQFASFYPKLVRNNHMTVLLVVNDNETNKDTKMLEMINSIRNTKYQNKYKIIKGKNNKSITLRVNKNKQVSLLPKMLPTLYILNDNNAIEIPCEDIKNEQMMLSLLN